MAICEKYLSRRSFLKFWGNTLTTGAVCSIPLWNNETLFAGTKRKYGGKEAKYSEKKLCQGVERAQGCGFVQGDDRPVGEVDGKRSGSDPLYSGVA